MVPLVVRSHFSLLRGTASVDELCRAARERGYRACALTDTDNLYGLFPFLAACAREGIRPIVGAEVTARARTDARTAVCLVENDAGYASLCRLLTARHREPAFDLARAVPEHAEGLLVLTAAPDLLEAWHARGVTVAAAQPRRADSASRAARLAARRLGLPAPCVPDSFFLDPEDHEVHRVLRAIALGTSLARLPPAETARPDAWLAPPGEYARRFETDPRALDEADAIAQRCSGFTGPRLGTVLPPYEDPSGRDAAVVLREAAFAGARRRYGEDLAEVVVERLDHELAIIEEKRFSSYFLVVEKIVRRSPRICGRGSGAASLVAYCLGITNVCPIRHNLYFERFLNPGRVDPPDIDVDFAWDERDAVLESVLAEHAGHSAMVSTHILFQPKLSIREVAKVFGLGEGEIERVSRRLPWLWHDDGGALGAGGESAPDVGLEARLRALPEMKELDFPEPWPRILALAQRILSCPRHLSVHPGGLVITPGPVDSCAPIETAPKGVPILQYEKDGTEECGLVKIDLLGNRSLGVIRDAIANLRENNVAFDEQRWDPEEDGATQAAIAEGRTMGCFYIESPAMRLLLRKAGVGDFEHLVIASSIIRPAANEFVSEYVRRLKGGAYAPLHPLLEEVLDETLGIMVYQEDVSKTAVALAGFSHSEADGLRKILTKKDRAHRLRDQEARFFAGARARGVDEGTIASVWAMMMSFDGYSFCKPHSASYARVSFQAAYLKVHHAAEFMAAVISNQGGFYGTAAYVSEARRLGCQILRPDVDESSWRWRGRGGALRAGLQSVKGLGEETARRIVCNRPFSSLEDLLERARPDEREARALIHAGACDRLAPSGARHPGSRTLLLFELLRFRSARRTEPRRRGAGARRSSPQGTLPLFDGAAGDGTAAAADVAAAVPAPQLPVAEERSRLRREFAALGFLCDRHPMRLFAEALERARAVPAADLHLHAGRRVKIAGWLIAGKTVPTKRGDPMEFLTFEDETGLVETTFFPEAYHRLCHLLDMGRPYLLEGRVEEDFGVHTLSVDRASRL
jgi:error-prone DNA polymerase